MKLAVVSHKLCWPDRNSPTGYVTDGGFPLQIGALADLFDETEVVVPCDTIGSDGGVLPLEGHRLRVVPLSVPKGAGILRKLGFSFWLLRNFPTLWKAVRRADAVHTPIPGDVGSIGIILALILGKRLFVRHCGNWLEPRTLAERTWKRGMEIFGGERNVMLATGGSSDTPSARNSSIRWIFSTSLRASQLRASNPRSLMPTSGPKLITACRIEEKKGVDVAIRSLLFVSERFPDATLDIIGGGSHLPELTKLANRLGLTDKVVFHGKVPQRRVLEIMNTADVFCFPTSASEGFPKVVLEALSCGLPVITTKISVLPQLLEGGGGILIERPDPQVLASAIKTVIGDARAYRSMSKAAILESKKYSLENWRDTIAVMLRDAWHLDSLSEGAK